MLAAPSRGALCGWVSSLHESSRLSGETGQAAAVAACLTCFCEQHMQLELEEACAPGASLCGVRALILIACSTFYVCSSVFTDATCISNLG